MRYFTDSPYERMMQEVPHARREDEVPPVLPGNKPCKTCQYNKPVCIGVLCRYWVKRSKKVDNPK